MDYKQINKASWNKRTALHVESDFYDVKTFLEGKSSLNSIELELLGDISGKSILHLQCHFGQDTISLSRMGAEVTGVDLSDEAIKKARELAQLTGSNTRFIESDIYELPQHLDETFDIVFTSYGTIGWLPDMDKWAAVVSRFLKPGGTFVFVEFHPVVWMFDDNFESVGYNYFNVEPIIETNEGTYAAKNADIEFQSVSWNHGLSEVINSLIKQGIRIDRFDEYNYSPYDCFRNTVNIGDGKFRIKHLQDKIPMVYSIQGTKATS